MNSSMKRLTAVLIITLGGILSGCALDNPTDSSIPWNRPADWEGQIPGMNGSGSQVH